MWSIFFKFAPDVKRRDIVNKVIAEKEEIAMAGALLMEISQDEHQRAKYRSRRMFETDKFHNEQVIKELAEARGEARGISIGEARGIINIARNLKKKGMSVIDIMESTGLSISEIENL